MLNEFLPVKTLCFHIQCHYVSSTNFHINSAYFSIALILIIVSVDGNV